MTALMVVMGGLLALAPKLRVPFPILLVLGGLAIAFVPGLPRFELPPDLVRDRLPAAAALLGRVLHAAA